MRNNEILKSRLVLTSNEYKTVSERDMPSENKLPDRLIILKVCVKFILNWGEFRTVHYFFKVCYQIIGCLF